jgi:hypothetical protein
VHHLKGQKDRLDFKVGMFIKNFEFTWHLGVLGLGHCLVK